MFDADVDALLFTIKAIMFFVLDIDDTLYLERDFVRSGYRAVDAFLRQNNLHDQFFEYAWNHFIADDYKNIIDRFFEEYFHGQDDKRPFASQAIEIYRTHYPEITLCEDARLFLEAVRKDKTAVITDGYEKTQKRKIDSLGLKAKIGKIVVTDDYGKEFWKPHIKAYCEVQGDLNAKNCVYIADNPNKDFIAPRKLSWARSVRIRRPGALHEKIETPEDCYEVSSFHEILKIYSATANELH